MEVLLEDATQQDRKRLDFAMTAHHGTDGRHLRGVRRRFAHTQRSVEQQLARGHEMAAYLVELVVGDPAHSGHAMRVLDDAQHFRLDSRSIEQRCGLRRQHDLLAPGDPRIASRSRSAANGWTMDSGPSKPVNTSGPGWYAATSRASALSVPSDRLAASTGTKLRDRC
jgi:hypothetical protein